VCRMIDDLVTKKRPFLHQSQHARSSIPRSLLAAFLADYGAVGRIMKDGPFVEVLTASIDPHQGKFLVC
jgi:hypothetical protein